MRRTLLMFALMLPLSLPALAQDSIRCESTDGRYRECVVEGAGHIAMSRQRSDAPCIEGRTWGVRDGRIWVDAGCRADFQLVARPASRLESNLLCESIDGRMTRCSADTTAGARMVRRISSSSCDFGRDWGYDAMGVWVSNGCRAEFAVRGSVTTAGTPTLLCESQNNRRNDCRAETRLGVTLHRQVSEAPCVRDRTWGVSPDGVWVTEGCRGEFALGQTHVAASGTMTSGTVVGSLPSVVCESVNNRRNHCRATTHQGVSLARQISDRPCISGRTWGIDSNGIWVTEGCRGEFALGAAAGTMASSAITQPATFVCESVNNRRSHCRVDTRSGISLMRQISDSACVRDRTWGVDRDGVWVTEGCRAEFAFGDRFSNVVTMPATAHMPTLVCESIDGRRNHCPVNTSMGVNLLRQISNTDCVLNQTWGVDRDGVWVNRGCRAEFSVGGGATGFDVAGAPRSARVLCESRDGKRAVCPADTRLGVAVVRQISDSPCVLNSTWGFDGAGIWVTAGCRAEFIMRR
jgi:hypothetical protein